jgi:YVTN family beta-propeller protein
MLARSAAILLVPLLSLSGQSIERPVRAVTDPGTVTTRQNLTPAGVPTVFHGRVHGVTFGASARELFVLHDSRIYHLDWLQNRLIATYETGGAAGRQSIVYDPVRQAPLAGIAAKDSGGQVLRFLSGRKEAVASGLSRFVPGQIDMMRAADPQGRRLMVLPLTATNQLAVVDLEKPGEPSFAPTGIAPFGAALSRDGGAAYVSNWGGRQPKQGDMTAPAGEDPGADQVVIDKRGVAVTGTVSRIDLTTRQITHSIPVGLHPTAIVWDQPRPWVYVANNNSDTVSVIDSRTQKVARVIELQPFAEKVRGIAPIAMVLSPDGATLYVACGGINAVAVVDTKSGLVQGMIPAGWYPTALALSPDGSKLAIASMLGIGSGWTQAQQKRYVHNRRSTVHVADVPGEAQLANYTAAVAENTHLRLKGSPAETVRTKPSKPIPVPHRAGDPSPLEHVVFIIKENQSYDRFFGDLPQGNGDPSLVLYGREITTNHHKLAEEFVLLDNLYATGINSADGHQWVTQAAETAYCMLPGFQGRSYPFDGTDPIAYASGGFLWDYARAARKTVRVYGEYAGSMPLGRENRHELLRQWEAGEKFSSRWRIEAPLASLNPFLAHQFPNFTTEIPDVVRAQIFIEELAQMEKLGQMPNLMLLQLPGDHTNGIDPGASTPAAMCADNDLALGLIVEALSKSRFWPRLAIFVIEDDAQNSLDHVDGHRTVGLVISPYVRRGHVDSTFYSTQSMVKSIELILGLPAMSVFDLIANDLRNSFTESPDLTPYNAVRPKQSLYDRNPPARALRHPAARRAALASSQMRWDVPDAVPTDQLNRIQWGAAKGWSVPYPRSSK